MEKHRGKIYDEDSYQLLPFGAEDMSKILLRLIMKRVDNICMILNVDKGRRYYVTEDCLVLIKELNNFFIPNYENHGAPKEQWDVEREKSVEPVYY